MVNNFPYYVNNTNEVVILRKRKLECSIVGVGKGTDEKEAIKTSLSYLPMESLVTEDDVVAITCNLVNTNPPDTAAVIGPESLRGLIQYFKGKKAKRIIICGGSGGSNTKEVLKSSSFDKIIEEEKAEFVDINFGPFTNLYLGGNLVRETKINCLIDEATVMVSFTQLKVHEEATMSGAIKNIALSWPPAEIHGYPKKNLGIHDDLHDFIYHMAKEIPIDLSIVSLTPAMVGTGPSKGAPVRFNTVLSSLDPVAIDTIGARILGFRPQAINYLFRCIKEGIGQGNIENISVKGDTLINLEKEFSLLAYKKSFSIDE